LAFGAHEPNQDYGRNQDVQSKEATDAIGEKLAEEQAGVQPVLQDPREELRVGENNSENAKKTSRYSFDSPDFLLLTLRPTPNSQKDFAALVHALKDSSCAGQIGL
jgi:hypothetical protein